MVTRKVPARRSLVGVRKSFLEWLKTRDNAAKFTDHQTALKELLMEELLATGEVDEKGSQWIEFDEPIEFTDWKGETIKYAALKRERRVTPATPTPDPAKAETLLKKKGLWLTKAQEKQLNELRDACPFIDIDISVNADFVTKLYFQNRLTDREYDGVLVPQKESFAFNPAK